MQSVELFGGAGGLALGAELAGFTPSIFVEWDRWACDTVRENQAAGFPLVSGWTVHESDVRDVDWTSINGPVDLVTGGPPCQPFSMGGKAQAADDRRDMFPAAAEVIRQLQPRAFLIENVKGLTRSAFANYYQLIQLRLQYPEVVARNGESWFDHLRRLQSEATTECYTGLHYNVFPTVVDAADYGVPQRRHRVFLVGFRSDIGAEWSFPSPTHSADALFYSQWVSGEYWERHRVPLKKRPEAPANVDTKRKQLLNTDPQALGDPWSTVRDALSGLPAPTSPSAQRFLNHTFQPGAKIYPGHTGSPLDQPAKTLKAGAHGVPGGENMLRDIDGSVRYFTVRESARLQTFPDTYELHGSWSEAMRQLGNAVPVRLAEIVAQSIATQLKRVDQQGNAGLNISQQLTEVS
ncbi:DNA cytosine methyltransferase [Schaalia sp. Marseille-Q2122]|uniref:DNA cytosine methyltransferase n=1 Tax=Schaalia sp. Marseille-Q2122 TaxID=2736604 RepID=UPI00158E303F|nr:DNA cytosine methyltransferase [Schaalia sp. Marseille-Q2122]